jgi:hypothetical protein
LAVVADGIAIPILWTFLSKKGNSNTKERIHLLNKFIGIFGKNKIECIVADREFVGTDWFLCLTDVQNIRVRIRIKDNYKINKLNGDRSHVKNFFRNISINQKKMLTQKRNLFESTHLNDYERLSKMMALLAIAFSWAYAVGAIKNNIDKIKIQSSY